MDEMAEALEIGLNTLVEHYPLYGSVITVVFSGNKTHVQVTGIREFLDGLTDNIRLATKTNIHGTSNDIDGFITAIALRGLGG